ncbi:hypothetical protein NGB36_17245 [Streptomyces sp. RB6PN25]|uniref:Uncharacterized protein n=1 Tax=Streptomyces humicola TaxID=2953240 RepID=A0ABT1PXB0_9ACTN|nr:hypothetical protein [Streptomyces humicola]MCQ4082302.1 hypothetical protein [Streptomyces humicola]
MTVPHLVAFIEGGELPEPAVPETRWEWRERLPILSTLLGYFHQDADADHPGADGGGYPDYEAIVADYFATTGSTRPPPRSPRSANCWRCACRRPNLPRP